MNYKKIKQRKETITRLYESGSTFAEISRELGISRQALRYWIKGHGGVVSVKWPD